jgi:hypothetical protein
MLPTLLEEATLQVTTKKISYNEENEGTKKKWWRKHTQDWRVHISHRQDPARDDLDVAINATTLLEEVTLQVTTKKMKEPKKKRWRKHTQDWRVHISHRQDLARGDLDVAINAATLLEEATLQVTMKKMAPDRIVKCT